MSPLPASANGASSFHLGWELESTEPLVEIAAVLEIAQPPQVDSLYFWALQATFHDGESSRGGAHLGLQWGDEDPPRRYANWGGYTPSGKELEGTPSPLPSFRGNPNTRDYPWLDRRPYRLRISPAPTGANAWRGEITDLTEGSRTVVRDLVAHGAFLGRPMVWSEVFADCDAPSVTVRWSGLEARTVSGLRFVPSAVIVSYQDRAEGGCDNTTAIPEPSAVLQQTNARRVAPSGARLELL